VPLEPDANGDAYRTLGLQPGASKAEVKRAYRLLAKAFHPDSAGEAALPRFLAIHEAYDRLTTGRVAAIPKASRAAPAEPWRADPARARQARERARTARGAAAGAAPGTAGGGGARSGASGRPASAGTAGSAGPGPRPPGSSTGSSSSGTRGTTGTRGSGRRHVRKATMGSTSYDEARDANDPTWSGASWYGPSSGEYWIINPREYADPRRHGPEYQSRARRPLPGEAVGGAAGVAPSAAATETKDTTAAGWTEATPQTAPVSRPSRWGSSPSASTWSGPTADGGVAATRRATRSARAGVAGEQAAPNATAPRAPRDRYDSRASSDAAGNPWLGGPADDPIRRLGFALVAWPPIGLATAALIGAATDCSSASGTCGGAEPLLPLLAQAGILGALLLLAPVTRILAGGAFAMLVAVVPLTLLLVVIGGTSALQAGPAPTVLLVVAWLVGAAWAAIRTRAGGGHRSTRAGT
jgi:hypothetical protein